jgi:hypothetical protein
MKKCFLIVSLFFLGGILGAEAIKSGDQVYIRSVKTFTRFKPKRRSYPQPGYLRYACTGFAKLDTGNANFKWTVNGNIQYGNEITIKRNKYISGTTDKYQLATSTDETKWKIISTENKTGDVNYGDTFKLQRVSDENYLRCRNIDIQRRTERSNGKLKNVWFLEPLQMDSTGSGDWAQWKFAKLKP